MKRNFNEENWDTLSPLNDVMEHFLTWIGSYLSCLFQNIYFWFEIIIFLFTIFVCFVFEWHLEKMRKRKENIYLITKMPFVFVAVPRMKEFLIFLTQRKNKCMVVIIKIWIFFSIIFLITFFPRWMIGKGSIKWKLLHTLKPNRFYKVDTRVGF